LNICLISEEYPPETGWGGIGMYVRGMAQILADRGHTVHVISASLDEHNYHHVDGKVCMHRIATRHWPLPARLQKYGYRVRSILERSLTVARYLSQLHKAVRFDVVEASNWDAEAFFYSLRPGAPLIVRISTPLATVAKTAGLMEAPGLGLRLRRWIEGVPVQRATNLITHSHFAAKFAQREYHVPADRIHVVWLGLDMTGIEVKHVEHIAEQIVLYVGRLEPRKGARYLLEAIPHVVEVVPNARFRLIGKDIADAPGGTSYQTYFAGFASPQAQAATDFLGFVDEKTVEQEYAACDVFVAPSLFESFGLIHLEAMARGKPVVACQAAATPEIVVDGETGLLVPPEDSQALAHAIICLLCEPDKARQMGRQGRLRAIKEFTLDRMVDETLAIYEQLSGPFH